MSYDQKCYDLAELFLSDSPKINNARRRDELAQDIQNTIEAYIDFEMLRFNAKASLQ